MLIEIKRDVIEEAIKHAGLKNNDPLDLLIMMAMCAKKGNHVVVVPSLVEDGELRHSLGRLITPANVNALCYAAEKHRMDVGRLRKSVSKWSVLTYKKEDQNDQKIVINPIREADFEPYTETFLLAENLIDTDFYHVVMTFYRRSSGLAAYQCKFYPLMGGGVTTCKVMENEMHLRKHFCLAIADSDRHRQSGPLGQTAKDLKKILTGTPFNCDVCLLEGVREIENLIPRKVVRYLYPLHAGQIDIFEKDPSFFDMKIGLCMLDLLDDKDCDYWRGLFPEKRPDFVLRDSIKATNNNAQSYEIVLKSSNKMLQEGFGTNLLKRVMDADPDAKQVVKEQNTRAKHILHQTEKSDLNTFQFNEWMHIGKIMFSWTCGMKAM